MSDVRPCRALVAGLMLLWLSVLATHATHAARAADAAAGDLPRYDLPVGRVLSYSHESQAKKEDGTAGDGDRLDVRVVVVAANADGSRRVVLRSAFRYGDQPEELSVGMFDIFPDGRATRVGRWNSDVSAAAAFPLLPPDAAAAAAGGSWTGPESWNGSVTTYTAAPSQVGDAFVFSAVEDGPIRRIYEVDRKQTIRFDRQKGVVVEVGVELTQGYGTKQTSRGSNKLVADETIDPARAARMAAEYDKLFEADAACAALLTRINHEPADAERLAAEAKDVLAAAAEGVQDPEVAAEFQRLIKKHEEKGGYEVEDAKRRLALLGQPLADWGATDLDGRTWSRDGLKGQIVVMDFWYRGCGWCIFAMPQVKRIAADYKDRGVVVLGMNTDRKEDDARFVVKALGLDYPQVRAEDLRERLGVTSFPTFLLIDQAGVVRGCHSGYSPDLGETLAKQIDELLKAKAGPAPARP